MSFEAAIEILGLERDFTKDELNKRYKQLVKRAHPDQGGSDYLYRQVREAHLYLKDK